MDNQVNPDDWHMEEELDVENLYSDMPEELRKSVTWKAIWQAIDLSSTQAEVFRLLRKWNAGNLPQVSEKRLWKMTLWAFENGDKKLAAA